MNIAQASVGLQIGAFDTRYLFVFSDAKTLEKRMEWKAGKSDSRVQPLPLSPQLRQCRQGGKMSSQGEKWAIASWPSTGSLCDSYCSRHMDCQNRRVELDEEAGQDREKLAATHGPTAYKVERAVPGAIPECIATALKRLKRRRGDCFEEQSAADHPDRYTDWIAHGVSSRHVPVSNRFPMS